MITVFYFRPYNFSPGGHSTVMSWLSDHCLNLFTPTYMFGTFKSKGKPIPFYKQDWKYTVHTGYFWVGSQANHIKDWHLDNLRLRGSLHVFENLQSVIVSGELFVYKCISQALHQTRHLCLQNFIFPSASCSGKLVLSD